MGRLIPVWTEQQALVATAAVVALIGAGAGLTEGGVGGLLLTGAVAIVFVAALAWDSWVGLVIGLGAAALVTFIRQATGSWMPVEFGPAAVESVALVATGWSAGRAGSRLRLGDARALEHSNAGGVFGSVGMLSADLGLVRLEEEVARGTSYQRPLSLMLLEATIMDAALGKAVRDEAFRAVARVTETMLREMDVPFLFTHRRMGAILPETDSGAAAIATGRVLEGMAATTFVDRQSNLRLPLASAVTLRLAVVSLSPMYSTAEAMLAAAMAELDR
jgi:GGDEF domain-containing protein